MADLIEGIVKDGDGVVVAGAKGYVYSDGVLATGTQLANALGVAVANPMVADSLGFYSAYATYASKYRIDWYWLGRKRFVDAYANNTAKGDPGGNVMAIGLFTVANTLTIVTGTDLVQTSGYSVTGKGSAQYIYDAAVNAAYVIANPRSSFVSSNGRGYRLSEDQTITPEMFGALGGTTNDQAAIQAAVNYAVLTGIKEVRFTKAAYTSWQPAFPGGSPTAYSGCHIVITGDVALIGAEGGTTITLKGPAGAARTKTDGVAAWYSGWLFYIGAGVTKSVLRDLKVVGGITFATVMTNAESNIYDKGLAMLGDAGYAPNLVTVDHRNVELQDFAGEIWYMGGSLSTAQVYVENLKLHNSPQACWNPGSLAKVVAVNLEAGDSYQPFETISGMGHTYIGGRFYNGTNTSFITTESFNGAYAYSYPFFTETIPRWTQFIGTRFETVTLVTMGSRMRGNIVLVDSQITLVNYGKLCDIDLQIEAWCDVTSNGSIVLLNGVVSATTQVTGAPGGIYYQTPRDIHIEITAKRTERAQTAGYKWANAVLLPGGLIDRQSCAFYIKGDLTVAGGLPAAFLNTPAAGSQFPLIEWAENSFSSDVAYPSANFSVGTGITTMGISVQAGGTYTMTLTNANSYQFAQRQRMRITHSGTVGQVKLPASGSGYTLKEARILYNSWDYIDLRWDYYSNVWVEDAYYTRTPLILSGTATYDPPSLVDGAGTTTTVTVTGAALGDKATASFSLDLQGISVTAYVSAANIVSVRFQNESGGTLDLASGTLYAETKKTA